MPQTLKRFKNNKPARFADVYLGFAVLTVCWIIRQSAFFFSKLFPSKPWFKNWLYSKTVKPVTLVVRAERFLKTRSSFIELIKARDSLYWRSLHDGDHRERADKCAEVCLINIATLYRAYSTRTGFSCRFCEEQIRLCEDLIRGTFLILL